jgi:hypothetical protein
LESSHRDVAITVHKTSDEGCLHFSPLVLLNKLGKFLLPLCLFVEKIVNLPAADPKLVEFDFVLTVWPDMIVPSCKLPTAVSNFLHEISIERVKTKDMMLAVIADASISHEGTQQIGISYVHIVCHTITFPADYLSRRIFTLWYLRV